MQEYTTAFHTTEVILVLILGSLPGAVIAGTSNYQINRFPPDLCTAANLNIFFHTFVLPIAICTTLGLIMSFTAFWILRRVSVLLCYTVLYHSLFVCLFLSFFL